MKRILLVGSFVGALTYASVARAQIPVTDAGSHLLQQLGIANQVRELAHWVEQLQAMERQYQELVYQYQAIAHLPQNIAGMARGLTTSPSLMNPFPQVGQISGILNGSSLGPVTGLANRFRDANRYYDPTGDDPAAVEMRLRAEGTSGIQAMAANAIESLQDRIASLHEFLDGIGDSPDIQQTAAIQARLQLEQNYVAAQQAQATNLATLAAAQGRADQQRELERARADAEAWRAAADKEAGWGE